jgi:NAD(P)H dehydrogenase (quinone)
MTELMSTSIRKVLVYGANGVQGGAIARELHQQGFDVRGLVRKPSAAGALPIAMVCADLEDASTLRRAHVSMDAVVLTLPLEWKREIVLRWTRNALHAAREAGVQLLILNSSARVPPAPNELPPGFQLRRDVETLLRESRLPSIVLHPPLFMENLMTRWIAAAMLRDRTLPYPISDKVRVAWLAAADLGAYVAAALRRPDLAGRAFDIAGPEALDGPALARALSPALGKPLHYFTVPPEQVARELGPMLGESVASEIALTYAWIAERPQLDLFMGSADELVRALHRPLLTVAEWSRSVPWDGIAALGRAQLA